MKNSFFFRNGIRLAGVSAFLAMILLIFVTVTSYRGDRHLISLWENYKTSEEHLFHVREDSNTLFEISHQLSVGALNIEGELRTAGAELEQIPSLQKIAFRKKALIAEALGDLKEGKASAAKKILTGPEMGQVDIDLRGGLFSYEANERAHLQERLSSRIGSQQEALGMDVVGIILALILFFSASSLVLYYVGKMRRSDRDLVAARGEAERASRMKSSFLANMSHEIRTPLNGVLGLTRLMRETSLNRDQAELIESLEASGRTLLSIVNDVLDLSKIESGKIELSPIDYDVQELLEEMEKMFRPIAERKHIRFVVEGPSGPVYARGDQVKIRQILQNMISNALKFTREGEVRLRWRLESAVRGPSMRFEVRDTGIGIPEDSIYRIFHPFEQADSSTSRHYGGSGLGLAICRHLVDAMTGEIGVESRVGLGSLFWFAVPFQSAERKMKENPSWQATAVEVPAISTKEKSRILLVEDNELNKHLVVSFLNRRGFVIESATNGVEALQALRQKQFDLILMDAHLPEMDGFEATKRIRSGEVGAAAQQLPIIALTASAISGERERCLGVGMDDYMTKPVDLDSLEKKIRTTLNEKAMTSNKRNLPHDLDEELFVQLVAIFRRVTPQRVRDLRTALNKKEWKVAGKAAHTMKSSAAQLGLWDLAEICKKMEVKGLEQEDGNDWGPLMNEFERQMALALEDLPETPIVAG